MDSRKKKWKKRFVSSLDSKANKSPPVWLENTIKWTVVDSLARKLSGLRCEQPKSQTCKNQSLPAPWDMRAWEKLALIFLCPE